MQSGVVGNKKKRKRSDEGSSSLAALASSAAASLQGGNVLSSSSSAASADTNALSDGRKRVLSGGGKSLFLSNIHFGVREEHLRKLLASVGQVEQVRLVLDRHTHKSRGFAFAELATPEQARRAVEELSGKKMNGRPMKVALNRQEKQELGGGGGGGGGGGRRRAVARAGDDGDGDVEMEDSAAAAAAVAVVESGRVRGPGAEVETWEEATSKLADAGKTLQRVAGTKAEAKHFSIKQVHRAAREVLHSCEAVRKGKFVGCTVQQKAQLAGLVDLCATALSAAMCAFLRWLHGHAMPSKAKLGAIKQIKHALDELRLVAASPRRVELLGESSVAVLNSVLRGLDSHVQFCAREGLQRELLAGVPMQADATLEMALWEFYEANRLDEASAARLNEAVRLVEQVVAGVHEWKTDLPHLDVQVEVFGSGAVGMGSQTSDADVALRLVPRANHVVPATAPAGTLTPTGAVEWEKHDRMTQLRVLLRHIRGTEWRIHTALRARVPLVRVWVPVGGVEVQVDITFCDDRNLIKSFLLRRALAENPLLAPLAMVVRSWAKHRGLSNAKGGLNSFCWTLMAASAMQQTAKDGGGQFMSPWPPCSNEDLAAVVGRRDRVVPGLTGPVENRPAGLLKLVQSFFAGFATHFRAGADCVSVRAGMFVPVRVDGDGVAVSQREGVFHVEDPVDVGDNVARTITAPGVRRVRSDLARAHLLVSGGVGELSSTRVVQLLMSGVGDDIMETMLYYS